MSGIELNVRATAVLPEGTTAATARVIAAIPGWWQNRAEQAGLTGQWLDVQHAIEAQPPVPFDVLAEAPDTSVAGASPHRLGQLYVESLTDASRSTHGRHYTPEVLAQRLWEMARGALGWDRSDHLLTGIVRDPAVGGGALLLPVIREHLRASVDVDPLITLSALPNVIHGVDADPWAVYFANVALASEALPTLARQPATIRRSVPALVQHGDGLAEHWPPALVNIQNPPYGRQVLVPELRARFSDVLYGHANLYGLFMAAGSKGITEDGVLAALVPTSFTAGLYFHRLREHLARRTPLHSITWVEDRSGTFAGVLQETCLATFTKRPTRRVKVSRANGRFVKVATVPRPRHSEPWLMPRESSHAAVAAAASGMPLTLATAGWRASTGPLVWNRRRSDIKTHMGKNRAMIVWAADMVDGRVTRSKARDNLRFLQLSQPTDQQVMVLNEPAVLVQRTTAPEQTRRLVAADLDQKRLDELNGRVVIENHVNVLRPVALLPMLSRELLTRVLNTRTMDRLVRCISGSVALSAYELESLPLPNAAVLASWEDLGDDELEHAVAAAYRP